MNDPIRKAFEEVCVPSFGRNFVSTKRKPSGEYVSDNLEDHWQTFQEGWEEAVKYLKNKDNDSYTDIKSTGGMDPRNVVAFATKGWISDE